MLSEKIRNLRMKNSLTQTQLANMLGCSVATVSGYETGKTEVPTEVISKCARYFNCPLEYFYNMDIPLMETPELMEKTLYKIKMKVIKDLSLPPEGKNVWGEMEHPLYDLPYDRVVWKMEDKEEIKYVILLVGKTPREGDRVAVVTDDGESKLGYYYVDETHNVCIKSKPKGMKGIRNLKVDLNKNGVIYGIVEGVYIHFN